MDAPVVTFLSDYGHADEFVGVVHGVIARICPQARIIDVTHGVPRHDVVPAALMLRNALPFMPPGVHLAIVDPDVGARRRAVAIECADGRRLVGPDNGVLSLAAERFGGVVAATEISASPLRLEPVSATFHGRDVFAPVAAHLAGGTAVADAGRAIDPDQLVRVELPRPRAETGSLVGCAVHVDRFGNVVLNVEHDDMLTAGLGLGETVAVRTEARRARATYGRTFADVDVGELLVYEDAARMVAIAVNKGDASAELGLDPGDEVRLTPA